VIHGRTDYSLPGRVLRSNVPRGGILKEQEAGERTADVCRRHGISQATFYKYKSKYGGLEVSDARKLRALEGENTKLKKLLAEQMLPSRACFTYPAGQWTTEPSSPAWPS